MALEPLGGGGNNIIQTNSEYSTISGGRENHIRYYRYSTGAGSSNSTIGGGFSNKVWAANSVISGGVANRIGRSGDHRVRTIGNVIAGGERNVINYETFNTTISGGSDNFADGYFTTIAGGRDNRILYNGENGGSVISGGRSNVINTGWYTVISGGEGNQAMSGPSHSVIPGGRGNVVRSDYSFAAGRRANANHDGAFVWADSTDADFTSTASNQFLIRASGRVGINTNSPQATLHVNGTIAADAFIGSVNPASLASGPVPNAVSFTNTANVFAGQGSGLAGVNAATLDGLGAGNFWKLGGNAGTTAGTDFIGTTDNQPLEFMINGQRAMRLEPTAGGTPNVIGGAPENAVLPGIAGATISGGGQSNAVASGFGAIGGGGGNLIQTNSEYSTISGGHENQIRNFRYEIGSGGGGSKNSTIGGGHSNNMWAANSVISGGVQNRIGRSSLARVNTIGNVIAGGQRNVINYESLNTTISGGADNWADGYYATIAGGRGNRINYGEDTGNTISGGQSNTIDSIRFAVISGGERNWVNGGEHAVIPGGLRNRASGDYSFAAGRRANANHDGAFVWADSADADFVSTADNEVSFRCSGGVRFTSGTTVIGQIVSWTPGSASWSFTSDRNTKEGFVAINGKEVLDKVARLPITEWNYKGHAQRHIGPVAQDFHALFPLNESETTLNSADLDGVALAAIQGLNQKLEEKDAEIQKLQQRLEKLERLITQKSGGEL